MRQLDEGLAGGDPMSFRLDLHRSGGQIILDIGSRFWMLFLWPGIPRLHYQSRRSDRRWVFPRYPKLREPF